jgi:hypothetical protein
MIAARNFGTALGPHIMRDGERTARPCTLCTRTNRPPTVCDLGKWVTAIYWGGQVVAGSNPVSPTQVRGCFCLWQPPPR